MADIQTEGLTFEKVWAALMESRKESREEMKEIAQRFKETDKQIGRLGNRFGEMVEHLVVPNIVNKFNALNFNFDHVSENHKIKDNSGHTIAEIDILLENGDTVIAIEVKSKPRQDDVNDHSKRLEILRKSADKNNDKRKYRGAIAGAIMDESVRDYAYKTGFYVIEQAGDTVKINIPEDFVPRDW
jgi:predicted AAA+ superfamily ATPase